MPHVDEGNRYADRVGDPATDRCAAQPDARRRKDCVKDRDRALTWVRHLSVDDQLCLEGNPMGDGVTRRCRVRAFVSDVGVNLVKLEVREVPPDSKYRPMQNLWFTEAALGDAYLRSLGYAPE
jgi:hypothetical protein